MAIPVATRRPSLVRPGWRAHTDSSQLPPEADRSIRRTLVLVKAMGVDSGFGRVKLKMGCATITRPSLCIVEESLSDAMRPAVRIDHEIFHPCPPAEPHRFDVEVNGTHPHDAFFVASHEDGRCVGSRHPGQRVRSAIGTPPRWPRSRRRKQPLVGGDEIRSVIRRRLVDAHSRVTFHLYRRAVLLSRFSKTTFYPPDPL